MSEHQPIFYLDWLDALLACLTGLTAAGLSIFGSYEAAKVTLALGAYGAALAGFRNGSRKAGL